MKKTALFATVALLLCLSSCNNLSTTFDAPSGTNPTEQHTESTNREVRDSQNIQLIVGGKTFTAKLYDTPVAEEFKSMLPLTIKMEDLHSNEKFAYLQNPLPTSPSIPSSINTGDLMVFGNNCLVLFYKTFPTTFSYTPIGSIQEIDELEQTLGRGNVEITFQ